jgi:preprotein translocase SecF subunit
MNAQALLQKLDSLREFHPQVTTVGEEEPGDGAKPDSGAGATKFAVKLKITEALAAQYEGDEKQAEAEGRIYQRPYVKLIMDALKGLLVPEAFTLAEFNGKEIPAIVEGDRVNSATLVIHNRESIPAAEVKATLVDSLRAKPGDVEVTVLDENGKADTAATSGANFRLGFDVPKRINTQSLLFTFVSELMQSDSSAAPMLHLSNPIPDVAEIGGRMVGELKSKAIEAMLITLFCIVMYIRVRFHEYKYGVAAVVALIHDVLIALGVVVFFNWTGWVNCELSLSMIAAFLTIIGYSINDTIVIFDRIRENLAMQAKFGDTSRSFADTINISINQTLARTILTSGTTFFVVGTLFVVNYNSGSDLEGFAFAMIIGIITGTYSTVFIASPIVMWLRSRESEDAGLSDDGGLAELTEEDRNTPLPAVTH